MRWPKFLYPWRHVIRSFVVYESMMMAVALVWVILINDISRVAFGSRLIMVGLGLMTFAVLSAVGAWQSTRSFSYQFSSTISKSILENQRDAQEEMDRAYGFVTATLILGGFAMLLGMLITFV